MRSKPAAVILTVGMTLIVGLLTLQFLLPAQTPDSPHQEWEYMIDSIPDSIFTTIMNLHGENGWELVFARRASNIDDTFAYEVIFKRPRVEVQGDSEDTGDDNAQ